MFEIYLISILDEIKSALVVITLVMAGITIVNGSRYLFSETEVLNNAEYDPVYKRIKEEMGEIKRRIKIFFSLFLFFLTLNAIIPSTKQAYLIYGIRSTVDYLRNNETAKQLSDKVVIALSK